MATFEEYSTVTSESYNAIKYECKAKGDEVWEMKKQEWKDAIVQANDADGELPPDAENAEVALYMERVLSQQEDLVSSLCYSILSSSLASSDTRTCRWKVFGTMALCRSSPWFIVLRPVLVLCHNS